MHTNKCKSAEPTVEPDSYSLKRLQRYVLLEAVQHQQTRSVSVMVMTSQICVRLHGRQSRVLIANIHVRLGSE